MCFSSYVAYCRRLHVLHAKILKSACVLYTFVYVSRCFREWDSGVSSRAPLFSLGGAAWVRVRCAIAPPPPPPSAASTLLLDVLMFGGKLFWIIQVCKVSMHWQGMRRIVRRASTGGLCCASLLPEAPSSGPTDSVTAVHCLSCAFQDSSSGSCRS